MPTRKFIFKAGSTELTLPVTPESYQVEQGVNIEVVNIHELGDALLAGYGTLATVKIDCLLPAQDYAFARDSDPERYLSRFTKWVEQKKRLRFIVSGTGVNLPVLIQSVSHGERDGTGDVYVSLILREYRELQAVKMSSTGGKPRGPVTKTSSTSTKSYTAVYGDTLCGICRAEYGDGSYAMAQRLAAYNKRPNPNILYVGEVLKIPQPLP